MNSEICNKYIKSINNKVGFIIICLILSTTIAMLSFSTATLLGLYSIWKMQVILFALLVVLYNLKAEKLYAVVVGACYLAPIVSYVYFYIASGPLLVLSSLGVICAVFAINYFVMSNIQLNEYSFIKNELIAKYGKVVILSSVFVIVAVAALYFLMPLVPIMPLIYTAAITWYASLLLICRTVFLLLYNDNIGIEIIQSKSSEFALSFFAEPIVLLKHIMQGFSSKESFGNLVIDKLAVIGIVTCLPAISLYAVCYFVTQNPEEVDSETEIISDEESFLDFDL
jgi:hypothetical protein